MGGRKETGWGGTPHSSLGQGQQHPLRLIHKRSISDASAWAPRLPGAFPPRCQHPFTCEHPGWKCPSPSPGVPQGTCDNVWRRFGLSHPGSAISQAEAREDAKHPTVHRAAPSVRDARLRNLPQTALADEEVAARQLPDP